MKVLKYVLSFLACVTFTTSAFAEVIGDFENGTDGWSASSFEGGSTYHAHGKYMFGWDGGTLSKTVTVKPNTDYKFEFLGAYSVKKNKSSDPSDDTYHNQSVSIGGHIIPVKHWVFDDYALANYSYSFNTGSATSLSIKAYAGSGDSFIKVDYFRLTEVGEPSLPPVTLTKKNFSYYEGNDKTRNKTIKIKVPFSRELDKSDFSPGCNTTVVHYKTRDGSAVDSKEKAPGRSENCPCKKADYFKSSGEITIKEGDKYIEIPVKISEDGFFEEDENFKVDLWVDDEKLTFLNTTLDVTLKNDDELRVGFYKNKQGEFRSDALEYEKTMTFKMGLNSIVPKGYGKVVVHYKTSAIPGEATPGKDYSPVSDGIIVFNEGDVDKEFSISIVDDNLEEGVEKFLVTITKVDGNKAKIPSDYAKSTGYIQDDDYGSGASNGYVIHDSGTDKIHTKVVNSTYELVVDAKKGFSIPYAKIYYSCSDCYNPTCRETSRETGKRYEGVDKYNQDIYSSSGSSSTSTSIPDNSNNSEPPVLQENNGFDIPIDLGGFSPFSKSYIKIPKYIALDDEVKLACTVGCGSSSGSSSCSSCSPPCSYWSSIGYQYSYNMTISKATLLGYKKYNSSTKQCEGLIDKIPLDISSIKDIKSGESKKLTFIPKKVYRCAKIQIEGKSDTDYTGNTASSKNFVAYSDVFATRPSSFFITADENNNTTGAKEFQYTLSHPVIAGKELKFYIQVLGSDGKTIPGYDENIQNIFFIKDEKYPTVKEFGFDYSGYFNSSSSTFDATTTYLEAGDLTITLKDDPKNPFALADAADGTSSAALLIPTYTKRFRVIPDHFKVTYSVKNDNDSPYLTFIADINSMASYIDMHIEAQNTKNQVTTRYEDKGYAFDTNLIVQNHIVTQNSMDPKVSFLRDFDKTLKKDLSIKSDGTPLINNFAVKNIEFKQGVFEDIIKMNFTRAADKAMEPIELFTDKLFIKETNGISGFLVEGTEDKQPLSPSVKHYYGRVHAPSPQTIAGTVMDSKIYYEVYCKNCDKSRFNLASNRSSIDSVYWYILNRSVFSTLLTDPLHNFDFIRFADDDGINSSSYKSCTDDFEIYTIKIKEAPYKNKVYYKSYPYLMYNKFNPAVTEHAYDVIFTNQNHDWAGEGERGKVVDTNISKISNTSLDW